MKIKLSGDLLTTGPGTPRLWMTQHQITLIMPFTPWQGQHVVYNMSPNDVELDYKRAER